MDAQDLADAFGLGRATSLTEPVARGELGEIRRLETEQGTYAVKQELEPWDDPDDAERAGAFHRVAWEAGVPSPEPLTTATGRFTADIDSEPVRLYTWVDLADPDTGLDPVEVGQLVARLHSLHHPADGPIHEWFQDPIGEREWKGVLKAAKGAGAPYVDRLGELLPHLLAVEEILTPMVPVQTCHLDLWADNLRSTTNGSLCLIDFDNCGPADPSRELAMVVFEFGQGDPGRQRQLHDAYVAAEGPGRVTSRADLGLTVAQLHHIGHRHLTMWLGARDSEARARSLAGVEEFLGTPLLLDDVDGLLAALA